MDFNPVVIDLSHHNDVRDWNAVKTFGILGVINKATEGNSFVDKTLAIREKPVRDHDILYGAYHYLRPGDPVEQADFFLKAVNSLSHPEEMLLALDHEDRDVPLEDAKAFLARILEKTGRRAILYSGFLIKEQLRDDADAFLAQHISGCRTTVRRQNGRTTGPRRGSFSSPGTALGRNRITFRGSWPVTRGSTSIITVARPNS